MIVYKAKINFYDCDPAGILFYGRIYNLCHSAYEEMISSFNLNEDYWMNDDYLVPIIYSEASYHKPVKYGDIISIEIIAAQLKQSSFELEYKCKNKNGEVCIKVKTVHVFIDKNTWKKKEIKKDIYDNLFHHFEKAGI